MTSLQRRFEMAKSKLEAAWDALNPAQRQAAEWDTGPLLVLAGPGSGKTKVLTSRVAQILDRTREATFRVLGLTFTNKAADEMRTRVIELVPGMESRLFLGTFHSFCSDVLRQHGSHLGIRPNFEIYSQTEDLEALLSDAVDSVKGEFPIVSDLDKKSLPVIRRLKSLLVFPDECEDRFRDREFGKRMAVVYPAYEAQLQTRNILDFDSLIFKAYELLNKFPGFARRYRSVYSYICVDEFQDTNHAQYQLLRALLGDGAPNLFVVADDDQIIYQWNGASHKRIQTLNDDYRPNLIQLPVNYRCPAEIVELANNLIQHNFFRTLDKKPLVSFRGHGGDDTVRLLGPFSYSQHEAESVAEDIKERHAGDLAQVVAIARSRKRLDELKRALQRIGIEAVVAQRKDEFKSPPLLWIHSMLRLANDRQSQRYLRTSCGSFAQLTGIEIDAADVSAQADSSHHDYLRCWIKSATTQASTESIQTLLAHTSKNLGEGKSFLSFCSSALKWCEELPTSTAKPGGVYDDDPVIALFTEEQTVWNELQKEILANVSDESSLEAFLQELQMRSKESLPGPGIIPLYTIHASKGKEFDHVYLLGMVDDELPSFQSKQKGDRSPELEEERRNCFVAITRTSKTLTMSYYKSYGGWPKAPSRFLSEMGILNN
jgi:DNA helicase II / ATP-dependent DNA helicase PcrA